MDVRLLEINLTDRTVDTFSPPDEYVEQFLGGSGLAFRLIWDRPLDVAPLDAENPLMFMAGLITGTPVPTACKASVVARSPQTGLWSESTVGGYWPAQLRNTGYHGLVITGRADAPVYLTVTADGVEFHCAEALWGEDTYVTAATIRDAFDPKAQVASIGPAGENGVAYASVMIGGSEARAAGRTGMGAVMGSKNLKAVAVRGTEQPKAADQETLIDRIKESRPKMMEHAQGLRDFGTAGGMQTVEFTGDLPIKNWYQGNWEAGAAAISGQRMAKEILDSHYACFACPIRCGKELEVRRGEHQGTVSHGPEYETCAAFGSMVLNDDMDVLVEANDWANRLGLDTISTGAAIAFAMECSEKGLIEDDLPWGRPDVLIGLIKQIAYREGLGDVLSQGVRRAAKTIGERAFEYVVETKNLEVAYHDPRAYTSMAVSYATGNRGACHLEGLTYYIEGGAFSGEKLGVDNDWEDATAADKAHMTAKMQDFMCLFNALGLCKFLLRGQVGPRIIAGWLSAVWGREITPHDLSVMGERLFNLKRMVNVELGVSRKDDTLSPRLLSHPRPSGGAKGQLPFLGDLLNEYYRVRGWSEEGLPEPATLERLGLLEDGGAR